MVRLDVSGDLWGEHIRTQIPRLKALAEIGGRDIFVDGLKQMDAAQLVRR